MHASCARITSLGQFHLRVLPGERNVVVWLAPIHVTSVGIVSVFDVETAGVTNVPSVVRFDKIRLKRTMHGGGVIPVSSPLGDVVCKGC